MYIFLNKHDILQCELMYTILNIVLYFVLYPVLCFTIIFVYIFNHCTIAHV